MNRAPGLFDALQEHLNSINAKAKMSDAEENKDDLLERESTDTKSDSGHQSVPRIHLPDSCIARIHTVPNIVPL